MEPRFKVKRVKFSKAMYDKQTQELLERQEWKCASCGKYAPLQRDHIVKRSQGGGDEIENAQMICLACHDAKDNQPKSTSPYWRKKLDNKNLDF